MNWYKLEDGIIEYIIRFFGKFSYRMRLYYWKKYNNKYYWGIIKFVKYMEKSDKYKNKEIKFSNDKFPIDLLK